MFHMIQQQAGESTWFGLGDDATWTALTAGLAETKNICQSENDIKIQFGMMKTSENFGKASNLMV